MWRNVTTKIKSLLILAAMSSLSACASPDPIALRELVQQDAVVQQNVEAAHAVQRCNDLYPQSERNSENAIPFSECMINAANQYYHVDNFIMLVQYKRRELAEQLHDGEITLSDYNFQMSAYAAQIEQQIENRAAQNAIIAAQSNNLG